MSGRTCAVRKAAALLNIGKQLGINLPDDAIQVLTRKVENIQGTVVQNNELPKFPDASKILTEKFF